MKSLDHTTAGPVETTRGTIRRWLASWEHVQQQLRPHFARRQPYQHALLSLQAILSEVPRKNGWQIAEQARQSRPYGIQRLLSRAVWDQDGVRDELRSLVHQTLCPSSQASKPPFPVLVLDESGFPKRGRHSAGVGQQYCGCQGQVENCQVGVFLSYVTAQGHALIDRELSLPDDWCADLPRRQAVHIPDAVGFRTKVELAQRMVQRAQSAGLPIRWVVADTVYGHSPDLRQWLETQGNAYALAVPCTEVVCVQTRSGLRLADVATIAQQALRVRDWQRLSQSLGTKGERLFDWALLPWLQAATEDGRHFLLIRRCLGAPSELAYYLIFAPQDTPLNTLVQAVGARWHIEEDLQACKDLGLDQYEVRSFLGWSRHVTLVLLAYALLVAVTFQQEAATDPRLIAWTPAEVRHLLAHLLFPAPSSVPFLSAWSHFRRTHQYWAGYYHRRRRSKSGSPSCLARSDPARFPGSLTGLLVVCSSPV